MIHDLGGVVFLNWKIVAAGVSLGVGIGLLLGKTVNENRMLPAETVLDEVKLAFKKIGSIDGSWMQIIPETNHSDIHPKVYRGGITRSIKGKREQIEFVADAYTGKILDLHYISA